MDVLIDLLFLIVLATMAHKTKRAVPAGLVFGFLKALSVYFIHLAEVETAEISPLAISGVHFAVNALIGMAIAFLVVKHAKNPKMVVVITILLGLSFLSHFASFKILSLF